MKFTIEFAVEEDSEEVSEISSKTLGTEKWSVESVKSAIKGRYSYVLISKCSEIIAGFCAVTILGGDTLSIDSIAVMPEFRHNGAAQKMLDFAFYNLSPDIKECILEVRSQNIPAIKLYEKLGFSQNGLRKNYYRGPADDAVLMHKNI